MIAHTKDERFVLSLYETAMLQDDPYAVLNKYEIGQSVGISLKGVNAICKLLLQANFIKKSGDEGIFLTKNGEALALRLKGE